MQIVLREDRALQPGQVLPLYRANGWSSAEKPEALMEALRHSHTVITAWDGDKLVGLGNAISDGFLVVYYPHLLVDPAYQGRGIGRQIVQRMQEKYGHFHQQMLVADANAVAFYRKCGFERAGTTQALWIYQGHEHT
ncbi:Acetyltransferase (GNAT) domain-containing protein [Catalinimonas alkaloidigena]|uniref:Acetyltransferase (GNAT) domain-containing protein n=1 Tax=Catalinimonas alkaloidigena TaxID=1075417 RepID=A0A1G8WUQ7_9BACT|nr:GNAT family N-acetyltransferase [Catalinimonas alkaloidigena]SDJ82098.1 Acetyltransferase (GNAT) domain-containing protein [Catalinimonas alkaloidigena]